MDLREDPGRDCAHGAQYTKMILKNPQNLILIIQAPALHKFWVFGCKGYDGVIDEESPWPRDLNIH